MNHETENKESLISELSERLLNGILKENPTFVLLLGMCPTLAVTTCAINGLGMGVTTMVVLALSNLFISLLRKIIPDKIRIPAFIVIIASFVTIVELLLEAYIPSLYDALGLYIPLIVVNCIILGRAEAYAYSHKPLLSLFDGIGMGMGFTFALTIIGAFRELLGAGTLFSTNVMPKGYTPVSIFIMAPGAFFVLAMLTAVQNKVKEIGEKKGKDMSIIQSGCGGNCMECSKECKVLPEDKREEEVDASTEEIDASDNQNAEEIPSDKKEETKEASKNSSSKKNKKSKNNKASNKNAVLDEKDEAKTDSETDRDSDTKEEASLNSEEADNEKTENVESDTEISNKEDNQAKASDVKADSGTSTELVEDDLEIIDIHEVKNVVKTNPSNSKKPKRKKASLEKAQAMLEKAEETLKEEQND